MTNAGSPDALLVFARTIENQEARLHASLNASTQLQIFKLCSMMSLQTGALTVSRTSVLSKFLTTKEKPPARHF